MATLSIKERNDTKSIKATCTKTQDQGYKTRLKAVLLAKESILRKDIASRLMINPKTITLWLQKYNKGGAEALVTNKGGRPPGNPKWNEDIFIKLAAKIDRGGYWSIPRMQDWISTHHKVDIPEQTVWYRMDKAGYSYKSARPSPVQGDKDKQALFKKGDSLRS